MQLYPLLMAPYFRSGEETPWGGTMLRDAFLKDAPEDRTGESLEISALPGKESTVANGVHAGKTLSAMISCWGESLTGNTGHGEFPLLLKLLDAAQTLSVQVHPGDDYALVHEQKLGKSEAWIVLNAEPGAKLAYGIDPKGEALSDILAQGRLEEVLNWVEARPGDVYYIPSGMIHALGGGIQVYEIQQSSDATYRLWDWGRTGKDGKPRELHTQKALDVTRLDLRLDRIEGATVLCKGGSRTYYVSDEHFELCRLNVSGSMPLPEGRMLFLTPTAPCILTWEEGTLPLQPFDSVLIPAAMGGVRIEGTLKAFLSSLPDQNALRQELGYRSDCVAGLVE